MTNTESTASLGLRVTVKLGRLGHREAFTSNQLLDLAFWFEDRMPRMLLEELEDKLNSMETPGAVWRRSTD